MKDTKQRINEIIGEASMCWSEIPKGVFNTEKASELAEEIYTIAVEQEREKSRVFISGLLTAIEGQQIMINSFLEK